MSKLGYTKFGFLSNDEIIIVPNSDHDKLPTVYYDSAKTEIEESTSSITVKVNCPPSILCGDKYCIVKEEDDSELFAKLEQFLKSKDITND